MKVNIEDIYINIPKHCRKLMKTEDYPKELEIYRGEMLCLTVDVEKAAGLKLVENEAEGPLYRKYRPTGFIDAQNADTVQSLVDLNRKVVYG